MNVWGDCGVTLAGVVKGAVGGKLAASAFTSLTSPYF